MKLFSLIQVNQEVNLLYFEYKKHVTAQNKVDIHILLSSKIVLCFMVMLI